jgi:hypothetical protein
MPITLTPVLEVIYDQERLKPRLQKVVNYFANLKAQRPMHIYDLYLAYASECGSPFKPREYTTSHAEVRLIADLLYQGIVEQRFWPTDILKFVGPTENAEKFAIVDGNYMKKLMTNHINKELVPFVSDAHYMLFNNQFYWPVNNKEADAFYTRWLDV